MKTNAAAALMTLLGLISVACSSGVSADGGSGVRTATTVAATAEPDSSVSDGPLQWVWDVDGAMPPESSNRAGRPAPNCYGSDGPSTAATIELGLGGDKLTITAGREVDPAVALELDDGEVIDVGNPFADDAWVCSAASNDATALAVGSAAWRSDDGVTWHVIDDLADPAGTPVGSAGLFSSGAGPLGYVVLAQDAAGRLGWHSRDLMSWHEIPFDEGPDFPSWGWWGPDAITISEERAVISLGDGAWIGTPTTAEPVESDVDYGASAVEDGGAEPLLDVWAPADAVGAPVLILLDGFPPDRRTTSDLAEALVGRGFVVLNADWQVDSSFSLAAGVNYHGACLVRFARANAERYGGDPAQVVVVGYSAGGSIAALLALNGDAIAGQCDNDESQSAVPDAIVGLAGGYEYIVLDTPEPGFGERAFAADADLWATMNPYEHLDGAADVKALLIHGEKDDIVSVGSTQRFAAALEEGGADVTTHVLDGIFHALVSGSQLESVVNSIDEWLPRG
jgi:acetyl esterase/lipase